ncbi:hypothetical protein CEXT_498211 [Caerostris extrusa]|uniref:Uncharacterized protein n=1 Tax=Caerostris extrusa TaxID=172846 RepID=A0AAV4XM99_CAEEX|nr:hypothetical protein CEXT_498211 [Caerostris extrusa]
MPCRYKAFTERLWRMVYGEKKVDWTVRVGKCTNLYARSAVKMHQQITSPNISTTSAGMVAFPKIPHQKTLWAAAEHIFPPIRNQKTPMENERVKYRKAIRSLTFQSENVAVY